MSSSMYNIIPGVSQFKSAFQAVCGDLDGAKQTQEEFSKGCPVVSQMRSAVEVVMGDTEAARDTHMFQKRVLKKAAETVPVVGHVAAAVHYAKGDKEKAKSAWHSSSKTACVVGTALPLAIICPPAAAPAAYGAALAYDASHSAVSGHKKGLVAAYGRILKGESNPGEVHDVLFGLGSMGAGVALAETGAVTTSAAAAFDLNNMEDLVTDQNLPAWRRTWLVQFLSQNAAWTFNFIVTNALFWGLAIPIVSQYGYADNNLDSNDAIPSGPSGSGVFPIFLMLEIGVMIVYVNAMLTFKNPYA